VGEVHLLPGVDIVSGLSRPDIADSLRELADRAERGDIESVVLIAVGGNGSIFDLLSTPELNFYEILGAIESIKPKIIERKLNDVLSHTTRDPGGPDDAPA
jgi:hypothetical protein